MLFEQITRLSKTLKRFYRRGRQVYKILNYARQEYILRSQDRKKERKKRKERKVSCSHTRGESWLEHISSTINIPRDHYAASTLIRVLFANLSTRLASRCGRGTRERGPSS